MNQPHENPLKKRLLTTGIAVTVVAACCDAALAHYLWVVVETEPGKGQVANVYFEESPRAGDGHYLDHFLGSSDVWIRTLEKPDPNPVKASEVTRNKNRWMQVPLPKASDSSIDAYGKFGVYVYGETKVLLHYYARNVDVSSHDAIHELGRAEQMRLDLVPHNAGKELELTLLWKGTPTSDRMVFVRGPKGYRENVKTDKRGRIRVKPEDAGQYTFRSSVEEPTAGEENGEAYELIRHNVTLVMNLPLGE